MSVRRKKVTAAWYTSPRSIRNALDHHEAHVVGHCNEHIAVYDVLQEKSHWIMSAKLLSESSDKSLTESDQSKAPKKLFFNTNAMIADEIADSVIDELFPELREEGAE